jgi:2-desacetyl-2-hydroxyethyl bacteriochlorophyllide A dehydrogenase
MKVLGVHIDGGMQEYISVPNDKIIKTPHLSFDEMSIVEPLAIGAHALRRASIIKGETVVVIGCGPIGIGIMKLAQLQGAKVVAIDTSKSRLDYVKNKLGVEFALEAGEKTLDELKAITNNELATVVVDASGNKSALESGIQYMAHGGRYVLVGLSNGDLTFNHPQIHAKETTLMCSRNATLEDFKYVIEVLEKNLFPTEQFITHRCAFSEMILQFDAWLNPASGVIKAVVEF